MMVKFYTTIVTAMVGEERLLEDMGGIRNVVEEVVLGWYASWCLSVFMYACSEERLSNAVVLFCPKARKLMSQ